jgi:Trk-type K+ transport system membrane component
MNSFVAISMTVTTNNTAGFADGAASIYFYLASIPVLNEALVLLDL